MIPMAPLALTAALDTPPVTTLEIAKRIAEGLGRPLVVKQVAWEGLVPALQNGAIDAVIAGMSETPERLQSVNFTAPYYESAFVMLVRADGPYASATRLSNFSGARVIGQKDTNYDVIIPQIEGVDHLTPLTSVPLIVQAILSDVADASPVERPVGLSVSLANPQLAMVVFEEGQGFGPQEGVTTAVSVACVKPILNSKARSTRSWPPLPRQTRNPDGNRCQEPAGEPVMLAKPWNSGSNTASST